MDLSRGCLVLLFGAPNSGKTSGAEHIILSAISEFRWGLIFDASKSEGDSYQFWPSKYVHESYSESVVQRAIDIQKSVRTKESNAGVPKEKRSKMFMVFDDMTGSIDFKSKFWQQLIIKRRHLGIVLVIILHYIRTVPPIFRETVDYSLLYQMSSADALKIAYDLVGMSFDNRHEYYEAMRSIKGKKGTVVLVDRNESTYRVLQLPNPTTWAKVKVRIK